MLSDQIGRPCCYCRRPMHPPTREHIRPRSRLAAPQGVANRTYACDPCNAEKGNRTLIEWLGLLIARGDRRAEQVASIIQSLCCRGRHDLCGDQGAP